MATDLGKVGIRMRGTWDSSTPYEVLDAVSYNSGLYIAKQAVPANTAPTNTTYWQAAVDPSSVLPLKDTFVVPKNGSITIGVGASGYSLIGSKFYLLFNTSNVSGLGLALRTNSSKVITYSEIIPTGLFTLTQSGNDLIIGNSGNYDLTITIYRMT